MYVCGFVCVCLSLLVGVYIYDFTNYIIYILATIVINMIISFDLYIKLFLYYLDIFGYLNEIL